MEDLDLDNSEEPDNPARNIADVIEQGRRVDSAKSIKEMLEMIPNARHVTLAAAFRCLGARKFFFDRKQGKMVFEPDYKVQLDAVKFLAAYMDGLPVETTLNVNVGEKTEPGADIDLESAIKRSPALRERLSRMIEER